MYYRSFAKVLAGAVATIAISPTLAYSAPKVVASIPPIHSLVSMVMEGVGEPDLILEGAATPHDFSLRPSHGQMLQDADAVFWVGEGLETFLEDPLESLASEASTDPLIDVEGLTLYDYREADDFKLAKLDDDHDHDHDDHGHDDHDDHAHDDHDDDHGKEEMAEKDHDHDHDDHGHEHGEKEEHAHDDHDDHGHDDHDDHAHDDHDHDHEKEEMAEKDHDDHGHDDHGHDHAHDHDGSDAHIWLDPQNAVAMLGTIAERLSAIDPDNAATYASNAEAAQARIQAEIASMETSLSADSVGDFVLFHDAFQYFEKRFGLQAAGVFTVNPEAGVSAGQVQEIRDLLVDGGANCIFIEPQFDASVAEAIAGDAGINVVEIDPLGAAIEPGSEHYVSLITNISASFQQCSS